MVSVGPLAEDSPFRCRWCSSPVRVPLDAALLLARDDGSPMCGVCYANTSRMASALDDGAH